MNPDPKAPMFVNAANALMDMAQKGYAFRSHLAPLLQLSTAEMTNLLVYDYIPYTIHTRIPKISEQTVLAILELGQVGPPNDPSIPWKKFPLMRPLMISMIHAMHNVPFSNKAYVSPSLYWRDHYNRRLFADEFFRLVETQVLEPMHKAEATEQLATLVRSV